MTGNKDWFITFDKSVRRSIRIDDDSKVTFEGLKKILMKRKDGEEEIISFVIYIPSMASNLIILVSYLTRDVP